MYTASPITAADFAKLGPVYDHFCQVAQADYQWPADALDFLSLAKLFQMGVISGHQVVDSETHLPMAFLLYGVEAYRSLEIKVIYLPPDAPVKTVLDVLMNRFLNDIKAVEGWDVISYPLMGPASMRYIDFMTWYGFKPIGQAVMRFHIFDGISPEIFAKIDFPRVPEGYRLVPWDEQYYEDVITVLAESFKTSVDALWDPRFRSREGMVEAFAFVKSGGYGTFCPFATGLLINPENRAVGACLVNIVSPEEANIPLIGLAESERRNRMGQTLLGFAVGNVINAVLDRQLTVKSISATVATGNLPAIKMYRRTGFKEDLWYPHVYQDREQVLAREPGQWC